MIPDNARGLCITAAAGLLAVIVDYTFILRISEGAWRVMTVYIPDYPVPVIDEESFFRFIRSVSEGLTHLWWQLIAETVYYMRSNQRQKIVSTFRPNIQLWIPFATTQRKMYRAHDPKISF